MDFTKAVPLLATAVAVIVFCATGSNGCYDKYLPCMQGYSISMSSISSEPVPNASDICVAVSVAMVCLENDAADCPAGTLEPTIVQNFKKTLLNTSEACMNGLLISAECLDKSHECGEIGLNLAAAVSGFNFQINPAALFAMLSRVCPIVQKGKACHAEFSIMCPNGTLRSTEMTAKTFESVARFCPAFANIPKARPPPVEDGCTENETKCDAVLAKVVKRNLKSGSTVSEIDYICLELSEVVACYEALMNRCPNSTKKAAKTVQEYSLIEQEICSQGQYESCKTTVENCVQPFTTRCQHASVENVEVVFECCGLAKTTLKCIKDSGCPDSFFPLGSKAGFESQFEDLCVGYNGYCSKAGDCFTDKVTSLETLCPNVSEILTCISKVCPDQSERGDLAVIHLRPVFKQICQGLEDYSETNRCSTYETCTETSIPAFPFSEETLQSYSSSTDPKYWCRIVRGVSECYNATIADTSCNKTSEFISHVTLLQSSTDGICSDVRSPCPAAAKCVEILFQRNHSSSLLSTCPNLPDFKSCVNTALDTCGAVSRVEAEYSLTQIVDLFSEACHLMSDNKALVECKKAEPCWKTTYSTHPAELANSFTDQTYWCSTVRRMLKCLSKVSPTCEQPAEITNKLRSLFQRTLKLCPYPLSSDKSGSNYFLSKRSENAGCSVDSSVLLIVFLLASVLL